MPQVASSSVIQSVRPETPGRPAAASEDTSGAFGEILDASATSAAAPANDGNSAGNSNSAAQSRLGVETAPVSFDTGALQAAASGTVLIPATDGEAAPEVVVGTIAPGTVTPVDLAILAQTLPAGVATAPSPGVPAGKSKNPAKDAAPAEAANSDKTDGSDDAAASVVISDVPVATIATATIVAVAAPPTVTSHASTSAAVDVPGANVSPSIPAAAPQASGTPNSSPPVIGQSPAPVATLASDAAAPAGESHEPADPSSPKAPLAALESAAQQSQSPADPAAPSEVSAEPVALGAAHVAPNKTKTDPRAPRTEDPKAEGAKTSATKPENAEKANDTAHPDAKPAHPQSVSEAHAGVSAEPDTKTGIAHQPHEQPSVHASATGRVAFAAAHSDLSTPAAVAQTVTAQLGNNPSALGINLAAPLASPLQSFWQPTPQRADANDNAVPIAGVAVEIVSRAQEGLRRFEIRLDPPELGRIDVRLDVDSGGNVTSRLTVDRADTLDLLRRDAPQLERALQHAGLNTEGGLQFSLRDQNFANRDQAPRNAPTFIVPDDEQAAAEAARRGYGRLLGLGGGIDIRV